MDYGSDIALNHERDLIFTPAGDVETTTGATLIAQDIAEEASIPRSSVLWDNDAGSDMFDFINDPHASDEAIIAELERLALKDPRVDAATVRAHRLADGRFELRFHAIGVVTPEALLFDLDDLFGVADE